MIENIIKNNDIIRESIAWADKYGKDAFPREIFKNYRRKLRRIGDALLKIVLQQHMVKVRLENRI